MYWRFEGKREDRFGRYLTNEKDYQRFETDLSSYVINDHEVAIAVESTGNDWYFKLRTERVGVRVVVVNTMKFKVVNQSVKKTDKHDASTLAEFLEKEMLPESRLCSVESEKRA